MPVALGPLTIEDGKAARILGRTLERLPALEGRPIEIRFQPALSAWRGHLLSNEARGLPVHAGSDLRKRRMILETALIRHRGELERIFIHELHHFVWTRIGNTNRRRFEALVMKQFAARGELGWSAEGSKGGIQQHHREERSRRWLNYVCESFCDTAAWYYSLNHEHAEWTLAPRFRPARERWFREFFGTVLSI